MAIENEEVLKLLAKQRDIAGKDYLTIPEAAHYCCVSERQFSEKAKEFALFPFKFMGKVVYRKADLQRVIEGEAQKQWQVSAGGRTATVGNSHGKKSRLMARRPSAAGR